MAKIVFITQSLGFGGASKMLTFVAESLTLRGHCACIININGAVDVSGYRRNVSENICVKQISSSERKKQIVEIMQISREFSADVIIGFTEIPNALARIVGFFLKKPSIMSERGDPTKTSSNTLKNNLVKLIIGASKGGVFQTEGAKALYGRGLRKRGVVIPNPIFVDGNVNYVNYKNREKSVVSVGRLDNFQKRYDVMLDAFKIFSLRHSDYVLKLYGRGSDEELIKSWVDERGLTEKVKFMGLSSHPMEDIARDGMFLITSDFEGISNSLLEAMAAGLPCVSTDHTPGGARLLITDHENGLLAPIGDSEALAQAMCEYAENSELAERCGENAKQVLVRFAPDRIIDMWEDYIKSVCK